MENSQNHGTNLYHFKLGIPADLKVRFGVIRLTYTQHAKMAALNDRYGKINLPETLNTDTAKVIEVETENGEVVKILYQIRYNHRFKLSVAVIPAKGLVKTVWLNESNDCHRTFSRVRYSQSVAKFTQSVKKAA